MHPVGLARAPRRRAATALGDQLGGLACGTARTAGSGPRRPARRPARPAPAARGASAIGVARGAVARSGPERARRCPPARCPVRVSRTTSTPADTIDASARFQIGQCGNSRKSTTCPRATPGARNIRSDRLPSAPPSSRPRVSAQTRLPSRLATRITTTTTATAITVSTQVIPVAVEKAAPALRTRCSRRADPIRSRGWSSVSRAPPTPW